MNTTLSMSPDSPGKHELTLAAAAAAPAPREALAAVAGDAVVPCSPG